MRSMSHKMIALLLAATAVVPVAAQAQRSDDGQSSGRPRDGAGRGDGVRPDRGQGRPDQPAAVAPAPAPVQAVAQQDNRGNRQDGRGDNRGFRGDDRRDGQAGRNDGRPNDGRPNDGRNVQNDRRDGRPDYGRQDYGRQDYGRQDYRGDPRGNGRDDRRGWSNNWRGDQRFGWQDYRQQNRNLYRVPRYVGPRGYNSSYRRWSPGYRIDPFYYGQSYWINDPWAYRLPDAYGDYRWVRYYDDVALIDVRTGLIRDIIYSFFLR